MSVTKTFSVTVKFSRDDAGLVQDVRGVKTTQAELSEDDLEYKSLKAAVIKGITEVLPIQSGIANAHISGSVSES